MTSFKQTLKYLYGLQSRGMKFGLRNIKTLLKSVGNPERQFASIHIAGTNGKGSTASFLSSIFMEAGYKSALYTSPHLVRFTERIRINGTEISEKRLVEYADSLRSMVERTQATFFEATTCIAFQYFADEKVDIAIIEAGLGGRLDSTNVLRPLVSVITNVAFDHEEYLGNTLKKIAREKGGIIKSGIPCVTGSTNREAVSILRKIAQNKQTHVVRSSNRVSARINSESAHGDNVTLRGKNVVAKDVRLGLRGRHQLSNARTAVAAVDVILSAKNEIVGHGVTNVAVEQGLKKVALNSRISGRLSGLSSDPRFMFDVAHNVDGLQTLSASLPASLRRRLVVVFGVMKDKNFHEMCRIVSGFGRHVVGVQPKGKRALNSSLISKLVKASGGVSTNGRSVRNGIEYAKSIAEKGDKILVVGSNYIVGEALAHLSKPDSAGL